MNGVDRVNMAIRNVAWKVQKSFRSRGVLGTVMQVLSRLRGRTHRTETDSGAAFDDKYGVDTCGIIDAVYLQIDSPNLRYGTGYQAIAPEEFKYIIALLDIQYDEYIFIDLGSGKGRPLLLASAYPFKRIIGVEYSPKLHQIALQNIERFRSEDIRCKDINSVCIDAMEFSIPPESAVFFFYNPFDSRITEIVLKNIEKSMESCSRSVWLVFFNVNTDALAEGLKKFSRVYRDRKQREVSIFKNGA